MYANITKQNWRGWAWNQTVLRTPIGSNVLVLAGDGGFDCECGDKKARVAIGIDTRHECVRVFRRKGGLAIHDRIDNQIKAMKPSGVILDFTSGMTSANMRTMYTALANCNSIVVNMLRGRESSFIRSGISTIFETYQKNGFKMKQVNRSLRLQPVALSSKHRGAMIVFELILRAAEYGTYEGEFQDPLSFLHSIVFGEMNYAFFKLIQPAFFSYRSHDSNRKQVFDSVAFCSGDFLREFCHRQILSTQKDISCYSLRRAAACKAHLTRRSKGVATCTTNA